MKILFIGDVVGDIGCEALAKALPKLKQDYGARLAIVNGENSASSGNGLNVRSVKAIFDAGADVITTGNHAFKRDSACEEYEQYDTLIRPANFGNAVPGRGWCELDLGSESVAVVNLVGTAMMLPADNPFRCAEEIPPKINAKVIIVDFHAEATAEKRAMGYFLAGRVSGVFGTHTHVPTADEQIIDGTGYITDAGMTGPAESILGVKRDIIIQKFLNYSPRYYAVASGECEVCGVCADVDSKTGRCVSIERFRRIVGFGNFN